MYRRHADALRGGQPGFAVKGRYALGIAAGPSPGEDDPCRVTRAWVASDEEFAEYATHIRLWQKALNDHFDFFVK